MAGPDYIVDIDGLRPVEGAPQHADGQSPPPQTSRRARPWLAVLWKCCSTYSRIYRNTAGDAYEGRCPRCGRAVHVRIGPTGTHARFFEAG